MSSGILTIVDQLQEHYQQAQKCLEEGDASTALDELRSMQVQENIMVADAEEREAVEQLFRDAVGLTKTVMTTDPKLMRPAVQVGDQLASQSDYSVHIS